MSTNF